MLHRDRVVAALAQAFEPQPWALAMWEGGAAAWGRVDEWSDLDLQLVVEDDYVDAALAALESTLASLSPITARHVLPQPTWHGHAQAFYQLADASPYLVLDAVVMRRSAGDRFLEVERHGHAAVVFDKAGLVRPVGLDPGAWRERLRRRVETLRVVFPMFQPFVWKEIHRGNELEALAYYHGQTLRPLVELLRVRHTPHQHDFGLRYAHYDLPAEIVRLLAELFFVTDAADIAAKQPRAAALFAETLAALDRDRLP